MPAEDGRLPVGFYATRHVTAENEQHATEACLRQIAAELDERAVTRASAARIAVEQVGQLKWFHRFTRPAGFTFYEE
jgi:hypothetical protein